MRIKYGKLYQYTEGCFLVSTNNGWKTYSDDCVFIPIKREKQHFVILMPDGEIANLYCKGSRLKLLENI